MLEFPDGYFPFNPPEIRLKARRIEVRERYFEGDETLMEYVRRKAAEWLGKPAPVRSKKAPRKRKSRG